MKTELQCSAPSNALYGLGLNRRINLLHLACHRFLGGSAWLFQSHHLAGFLRV